MPENSKKSNKTREKIVETAGRLFAERGFQVTTRKIAEASGTNIGSISYYFGNKEGLIEAVFDYATDGWKNHRDVIDYIITSSQELLTESEGRRKVLQNVFEFLFRFYISKSAEKSRFAASNDKIVWKFCILHSVMSSKDNNPYKIKLIERVLEPNRQSFNRLILALCPNLPQEEAHICCGQFFMAPLLHYSIIDLSNPLPYAPNIDMPAFIEKIKETLANAAWLFLEKRRAELTNI